jgi:hypothetical protein
MRSQRSAQRTWISTEEGALCSSGRPTAMPCSCQGLPSWTSPYSLPWLHEMVCQMLSLLPLVDRALDVPLAADLQCAGRAAHPQLKGPRVSPSCDMLPADRRRWQLITPRGVVG